MATQASLHKLSDTNLVVADPVEDVRGKKVVDRFGDEIGSVDDLLIDDREKKVRFLQIASGGFLGIGETTFLLPVDAVKKIIGDTVHIDKTREHIAGSPRYDPDLIDDRYLNDIYGYYGFAPYWGPGYVYPAYPYYPY